MDTAERCHRTRHGQIVWGVLLIGAGALMFLDRLDLTELDLSAHIWPLLPLGLGVLRLVDRPLTPEGRSRYHRSAAWLIFIGCWGLLNEFHVFGLDYANSWPLVVIFVGLTMVWRSTGMPAPGTPAERRPD